MKAKRFVEGKEKIDWGKELRASHFIREIESYLETYWDNEYILFKIKKVLAKYHKEDIEEIMDKWKIEWDTIDR